MHNLKTVSSRLIRKEYTDGINQIIVSQCSGLELIALPVVAALRWIRSNNRLNINVKSHTNGSLVPHPFDVEVYDCQFAQGGTSKSSLGGVPRSLDGLGWINEFFMFSFLLIGNCLTLVKRT